MRVCELHSNGFGWPYTPSPHDSGMLIEDVYPCMYFGAESLDEIQRKATDCEWAGAALAAMSDEASRMVAETPMLDIGVTSWRHSFYAPDTGGALLFDPSVSDGFTDPETGKVHRGEERTGAWRQLAHERIYRIMRSMAMLYRYSGNERFAEWAMDVLAEATRMFSHDELRNPKYSNALYNQPLYDSQILSLVAVSYKLLRPYLEAHRNEVAVGIVNMCKAQLPRLTLELDTGAVHNTSAHIALAVALIGEAVGDAQVVARGLTDSATGLEAHFEKGLKNAEGRCDGFWFEGTLFYHLYTMCPLIEMLESSRRNSSLFDDNRLSDYEEKIKSMFEAILALTDHRGRIYCVGDFGAPKNMKLTMYRHLFEYAYGRLKIDSFGPMLSTIYANGPERNNLSAICYGADRLPEYNDTVEARASSYGWTPGETTLRRTGISRIGATDRLGSYTAWLKCGAYGGGHDHTDSLSFGLHVGDSIVSSDLGSPGYGLTSMRPFYKSTLSHNTILVDDMPQCRVTESTHEEVGTSGNSVRGIAFDAYDGVRLERNLRLEPPFLYIEDSCKSEDDHRYSWAFHAYGSLSTFVTRTCDPEHIQPLPDDDGLYGVFSNRETAWTDEYFVADWRVTEFLWARLIITANAPMECTTGRTPGNPLSDTRGTVIVRCRGSVVNFAASIQMHSGWPIHYCRPTSV